MTSEIFLNEFSEWKKKREKKNRSVCRQLFCSLNNREFD